MIKTLLILSHNVISALTHREMRCKSLFPLYHITPFCNMKCAYCDGFPELGLSRDRATDNNGADNCRYQLSTKEVKHLLSILKRNFDFLFITGGEPLVRDDIEEIMDFAGHAGFHGISLSTNSLLLPEKEEILTHVSNLVISLDMLDPERYGRILGCGRGAAQEIVRNVERYKELERKYGYKLKVHTVILPDNIHLAGEVLDFCHSRDISICLSPLQTQYKAHCSFEDDGQYRNLINRIIELKKKGARISGTRNYYRNIRKLEDFRCIPMLIPRILPNGNILYPCRPKGNVAGNIVQHGSWDRVLAEAERDYGRVENCDRSCRIRCYIEPSLLMKDPVSMVKEFIEQI